MATFRKDRKPFSIGAVDEETGDPVAINRLTKDIRAAARVLSVSEARWLVNQYYIMQKARISSGNQTKKFSEDDRPNATVTWFFVQADVLETQVKNALNAYAKADPVGQWCLSITGIGPVLAAGMIAHFDIAKAPTVGHFWNIAGLNPDLKWYGKDKAKVIVNDYFRDRRVDDETLAAFAKLHQRRPLALMQRTTEEDGSITRTIPTKAQLMKTMAKLPWDARLKTLCWKIGESFVMQKGNDNDDYGRHYTARKLYESEKNEKGDYAQQALAALEHFKDDTVARSYYEEGKLPPGHIDARARRYTVKLFLSHLHEVAYRTRFNAAPPVPFAMEHRGHAHFVPVPRWPMAGREAAD